MIDKGERIDVLFIAEGTYPYIRGGVSTWIHQLITGMQDIKFGVLFLGSREEDYEGIKYDLPDNLVFLKSFFLFSKLSLPPPEERRGKPQVRELITLFSKSPSPKLADPDFYREEVSFSDFLYGKETWYMLEELYENLDPDIPFIDFFWTVRNILTPLWVVVNALDKLRDKDIGVVHSPSTGYAGFLGALLRISKGIPYIVTEHGIYTRERKIDILSSAQIRSARDFLMDKYDIDIVRKIWIDFFINLGYISYRSADRVYSLFERARNIQTELGCPPEKTEVIPNGVDIAKYRPLRRKPDEDVPQRVALIGRVTPIKDVKTFIKAMKLLTDKLPQAEGWIVGPEDEDPSYAQECRMLVKALGLEGKVKFLGFRKLEEVFPTIGLTTLTSVSEGMPIVVLESFAAGVPCVTTDVGSCRQLIYGGLNEEDKRIGKAGEVVSVGNVSKLAEAYERLLTDKELWFRCQEAAVRRVENFYSMETFLKNYQNVYESFLGVGSGRDFH
ncbi:glycosyltransferase involved in cell wall biosynthesis [Hydrogenivirga caldilitoris]|uniref:Glycosyltransferase involved in cell wall biosynthesis n=1 Tax=Hydrogenivirga caldilitoris TaxID=246264 RepID=A0A497XPB6_9AQUI|nr:GT4 family glycosyltransferase PelF [Hydrogenivirga caldilitoris]RLJ70111.1 glycosyltransferase involved in cell wall biosynthesis [Hydrogenivirga caldilitoris]